VKTEGPYKRQKQNAAAMCGSNLHIERAHNLQLDLLLLQVKPGTAEVVII
jgi:hypothetical protein